VTGSGAPRSRRQALGLAGAAAAAAVLPRRGWAMASPPIAVGEARLRVFSDGDRTLPFDFLYGAVPDEDAAALFAEAGATVPASLPTPNNVTLIEIGDRRVLIDAGSGPNFDPMTGRLETALVDEGIDPDSITDVVFTHGHPDHFWGALDDFEEFPRFPGARLAMTEAELAYWRDLVPSGPDDFRTGFALAANRVAATLGDTLEPVAMDAAIAPGVRLLPTPGHTPGHASVLVESGNAAVLILGDALTNPLISFRRPDWAVGSDDDAAEGAATRVRLLDMLAADAIPIIGFHLPFPGLGRAERAPDGTYRFVPAA
jgi:glyoxylase-like metal-dependent hydrolase (beta-lactamase superfamily II)